MSKTGIKEKLRITPKGWITYKLSTPRGVIEGKIDNLVVPNAKTIIAKALYGASLVDNMSAYATSSLLATTTCSGSLSAPDSVMFVGEFDEASFNGTLDELRLESSSDGSFSEITGLSIAKDNLSRLSIVWTIQLT